MFIYLFSCLLVSPHSPNKIDFFDSLYRLLLCVADDDDFEMEINLSCLRFCGSQEGSTTNNHSKTHTLMGLFI